MAGYHVHTTALGVVDMALRWLWERWTSGDLQICRGAGGGQRDLWRYSELVHTQRKGCTTIELHPTQPRVEAATIGKVKARKCHGRPAPAGTNSTGYSQQKFRSGEQNGRSSAISTSLASETPGGK